MKKLSLLIAMGIACSIAIAKPALNASTFETYSAQMQQMSEKYIAAKQYGNANKTIEVWLSTYQSLSDKDKLANAARYAEIMYNRACSLTQTNEMFQALKALKEAVKSGFSNRDKAENDPNLSKLKTYEEFGRILQTIKA